MRITAEMSLYPLDRDFVGPITAFIRTLREQPGLEVVTNQMSTQVRGDFAAVASAVDRCLEQAMAGTPTAVLVVKYLNADLDIGNAPRV